MPPGICFFSPHIGLNNCSFFLLKVEVLLKVEGLHLAPVSLSCLVPFRLSSGTLRNRVRNLTAQLHKRLLVLGYHVTHGFIIFTQLIGILIKGIGIIVVKFTRKIIQSIYQTLGFIIFSCICVKNARHKLQIGLHAIFRATACWASPYRPEFTTLTSLSTTFWVTLGGVSWTPAT